MITYEDIGNLIGDKAISQQVFARLWEVIEIEKFFNCDQYVVCFRISDAKRYLVWLPKNKEFAIVDRDHGTNTWFSGDYLGHDDFAKALKTLRKWEK